MNLNQLKAHFWDLPQTFLKKFIDREFKTCWYGSAGLDTKPLDFFTQSTPNGLLDDNVLDNTPIEIYFFTDTGYNSRSNYMRYYNHTYIWSEGIFSEYQYQTLVRIGTVVCCGRFHGSIYQLVEFDIKGVIVYVFYIAKPDEEFENILIANNLKIDVGCSAGGWAGPGPVQLDLLGMSYYLGNYRTDPFPFSNIIINSLVPWGLCGSSVTTLVCNFYKLTYFESYRLVGSQLE